MGESSVRDEVSQIVVENPATGRSAGEVPNSSTADVAAAAAAARAAQPEWEAMGFDGRRRALLKARKWLASNRHEVVDALVAETGKPSADAVTELALATESFAYWAKRAEKMLRTEKVREPSPFLIGRSVRVRWVPVGLVGVITPWNAPFTLNVLDSLPALAAGNAVLLKPSEVTPFNALVLEKALRAGGVPDGVFRVVTGDGQTGAALVDEVDFVMFTGSTATGRKIMQRAAEHLTPVAAELGGNDPAIVLADADLKRAASGVTWGGMFNAGQVCMGVERVYVEAPVYDEFVDMVVDEVKKLRVGGGDIGPIIHPPQIEIIDDHVRDAVDRGARVLCGGEQLDREGRYYAPTVLVDVDSSMKVMREETFGPVLPIVRVANADEAVELANDSDYGLQASIWSGDISRAETIATRVESGGVCVNDVMTNLAAFGAPFGGWKSSGVGGRHGEQGIKKYCKPQTVMSTRSLFKRELTWFPYSGIVERAIHGIVIARARLTRIR